MLRFAVFFALLTAPTLLQASIVKSVLSTAEVRGEATYRFIGLSLYQARLYTKDGAPLDWNEDFGIELNYLRGLTKRDLVEGTLQELERAGNPLPVREQLAQCFDDVRKGDQYLAVSRGQDQIGFWRNGVRVCTLSHPQIKQRFMAIFVGENTRSKSFTRKLKGD